MDQQDSLERLLTEIRDSERTLVEEMRRIREGDDYDRRLFRRLLFVLAGVLGLLFVAMVIPLITVSQHGTSVEDTWERQRTQYQQQLDKADEAFDRSERQAKRSEEIQKRWEKQADRIDALIGRWEKATPQE